MRVAVDLVAAEAAVESLLPGAGTIALRYFRTELVAHNKGGREYDPVTQADRGIESHLRTGLAARFPDHLVIGEEDGASGPDDSNVAWLIDPIDGTKAFVSGTPQWGILVGLVVDGRPVAGWVHQPYLEETFAAVDGSGWLERREHRRPLATRRTTELADAVLYSTHPSMFTGPGDAPAYERLAAAVRLHRFGGDSYSYCLLALGFVDLVVDNHLQPYDIVPLIPIVQAAGGVVTDRGGGVPMDGGLVVAAATPELHEAALARLG
jgi:histidinol phosphatase-like enzyme (inositol monophosphatase family)